MNQDTHSPNLIHRLLLAAALLPMLFACGGGDGSSSTPSPAGPAGNWSATGALVYRNSSQVGIYDFATGRERVLDPGTKLFTDSGIGALRGNRFTLQQRTADGWDIVLYDKYAVEHGRLAVTRPWAISTSAAIVSPDGTKLAFSVSEPRSASDDRYIERSLLMRISDGAILAVVDGYANPVWLGRDGAFVAHHETTLALHRFDAQGANQGAIGNLFIEDTRASYDTSLDGRFIAYTADGVVRLYDIQTGADRLLVQSNNGLDIDAPMFSPDGRGLAVLDVATVTLVPYVVEIPVTGSVTLSDANRMSQDTIAEIYGRMGWIE